MCDGVEHVKSHGRPGTDRPYEVVYGDLHYLAFALHP